MENRYKCKVSVVSQKEISDKIYDLWISFDKDYKAFEDIIPGQFVSVYSSDGSRILPRPISICETDKKNYTLRMVYRVVGKGTDEFSRLVAGDTVEVLAPLGNGYNFHKSGNVLMGGGIGIPPMLELAKKLSEYSRPTVVLGYKDDDCFLKADFEKYADVLISSDDGSVGTKGTVIDALKASDVKAEHIYACGPMPMLRGIKNYAHDNNINAQISLEERMACGVGACLGCVSKTVKEDGHSHVFNTRICTDGPVFDAEDVDI